MSLVQRDYILRLIEAVGAALARILKRRQEGDLTGARREVDIAVMDLLGRVAGIATHADSRTAADLVGDGHRLTLWAQLLTQDADLLRLMGREAEAASVDRRAVELLLEAYLRDGTLLADASALLATLSTRVPDGALPERYRSARAGLPGEPNAA